MNAERKVGPEKLGQAALHSRGLEDSRRLRRQGHNTHFKVKSCKALIPSGRAGRSGKRGSSAAVGLALWPATSLESSDRRGSRFSSVLTTPPPVPARPLGLCCEARQPGLESGAHQGGEVAPLGGWMQLEPRKAFFRNPGLSFLLLPLPIRLNGPLHLFPPQFFGCNGMFHCPSGPLSALHGTLALLPGKAPDVTALRDPEQPPPTPQPRPSYPCALSLSPFPRTPWIPD